MKRKIFLTIAFLISLAPMIANQFGGVRGVREISGFASLMNPIGIISFLLVFAGIWIPFKNVFINKLLGIIGLVGMITAEILTFLLWPIPIYQESINLQYSFANAFPEFYVNLATSTLMLVTYVCAMSLPDESFAHSSNHNKTKTHTVIKSSSKTVQKKPSRKPTTRHK